MARGLVKAVEDQRINILHVFVRNFDVELNRVKLVGGLMGFFQQFIFLEVHIINRMVIPGHRFAQLFLMVDMLQNRL